MDEHQRIDDVAGLLRPKNGGAALWPRPALADEVSRVLAVCEPGSLEDRLRTAARMLGQDVRFLRTFPGALETLREQFYEIVVVAKTSNGMLARDFVRETKRISDDSVVVVAAPDSQYDQVVEVLVEGAYDFVPQDADGRQLRLMLGRAMDHSHLRRRSNQLERALDAQTSTLQQRLRELAMLNELAQDMISVADLDEILRRALNRVIGAFGCECGSFLILDPEADELVVRVAAGLGAEQLIGQRRKLGEGVSGKVASERHPVLVTDVANDSRFRADALSPDGIRHYHSGSFLAMPLIYHGRLLGEMNVTERASGAPFTQDDLRLFAILGGHVASAINGALAAEELKTANEALRREMSTARERLSATDERLGETEVFALTVIERLPAAMVAFDPDRTVTFANEAAHELLGLERGGSLKRLAGEQGLAAVAGAAADVITHGTVKRLTATVQVDLGLEAQLRVVVAPLRRPAGRVSGGTIIATLVNCPFLSSLTDE